MATEFDIAIRHRLEGDVGEWIHYRTGSVDPYRRRPVAPIYPAVSPSSRRPRVGLAGFLLVASIGLVSATPESVAQTEIAPAEQSYDIPPLPLNAALARFGQISHVDIIYDDTLARTRRSAAISGRFAPQQALARLLAGTGLSYRFTRWNAALIYAPDAVPTAGSRMAAADPVLVLDTLEVRASAIVGSPGRAAFDAYGRHVLASIDRGLRPEAVEAGRAYRVVIRLWIAGDGRVRNVDYVQSSGNAKADQNILARLSGLHFEAPPPEMPQPIRLQLEAR